MYSICLCIELTFSHWLIDNFLMSFLLFWSFLHFTGGGRVTIMIGIVRHSAREDSKRQGSTGGLTVHVAACSLHERNTAEELSTRTGQCRKTVAYRCMYEVDTLHHFSLLAGWAEPLTLALLWIFKEPIYYWLAFCGCGFLFKFFLVPCCLSLSVTKPYLCAFMSSHSSFLFTSCHWINWRFERLHKIWHECSAGKEGGVMGMKDGGQPEMSGRVDRNRGDREGQLGPKWRVQCIRMTECIFTFECIFTHGWIKIFVND